MRYGRREDVTAGAEPDRVYPAVRVGLAGAGVLAAAWLAERSTVITGNPLDDVSDRLNAHLFLAAATMAATAATEWTVPRLRTAAVTG